LARKGSCALRDWVASVWLELGGPATVRELSKLRLADDFFDFLDSIDTGGDCPDNAELLSQLKEWRAERSEADEKLQIMTMHKAKGLEFDTVILPGLGYPTRKDERRLLVWHELPETDGERPIVLAPLHAAGDDPDDIYEFLWRFDQYQASLEQDRLLYVATTRARKRLHLMAPLSSDGGGIAEPVSGSLLKRLWPAVREQIKVPADLTLPVRGEKAVQEPDWFDVRIDRLRTDWVRPEPPAAWRAISTERETSEEPDIEFAWVSNWAIHAGSVVHEWLQLIAEQGPENFDGDRIAALKPRFEQRLRQLGIDNDEIDPAVDRVVTALVNALSDDKGRWILFGEHADAHSEFSLTVPSHNGFEHIILDRTFVCAQGQRWIVDYKTSDHKGGDLEGFLRSESERHRPQLKRYRDAIALIEKRPIRTALYFPLLGRFHEVDTETESLE